MRHKLIVFGLFYTTIILAQEPIQTDRPDQTETPAIVPKGMFQVESGYSFQKNDKINKTNILPSTLWKYGINENFELRLITELISEELNNKKTNGFNPIYIGFKAKISDEKGIIPKTSFIGHVSLPNAASKEFKNDYLAPEFRFVMQHTLYEKMSFSYNLGAEWNGFTAEPTFIYTIASGYTITEKLGCYIELFGFIPQIEKSNHSLDGGFTYLITDNFMLDLSSGIGVSKNAPKNYIAFGISFRR